MRATPLRSHRLSLRHPDRIFSLLHPSQSQHGIRNHTTFNLCVKIHSATFLAPGPRCESCPVCWLTKNNDPFFLWHSTEEEVSISKFRNVTSRSYSVSKKKGDASCASREVIAQKGTHVAARRQVSLRVTCELRRCATFHRPKRCLEVLQSPTHQHETLARHPDTAEECCCGTTPVKVATT